MTQCIPDTSSNGSGSFKAAQYVPNTELRMGQFHWPHPGHIPHAGFHYPTPHVTQGAHQGPGLVTRFAPPHIPQASGLSTGVEKRVTEDLGGRDVKRVKTSHGGMRNDPLFRPVLDQHGQRNGKFVCLKDGMVLNPESYLKHIKTKKHVGHKIERFKCPVCSKTFTRLDACKRHFHGGKCGKSAAGEASTSSSSVTPVMVPTMAFTYPYPCPMPVPQHMQTAPPATYAPQPPWAMPTFAVPGPCLSQPENDTAIEPAEDDDDDDDDDADFWENNEIRDVVDT